MSIVRKNRMAMMELKTGIVSLSEVKINGSVSKMRPGPAPGSIPAEKTAGIMAKLAIMAKRKSETPVAKPVTTGFSCFLIYEEDQGR